MIEMLQDIAQGYDAIPFLKESFARGNTLCIIFLLLLLVASISHAPQMYCARQLAYFPTLKLDFVQGIIIMIVQFHKWGKPYFKEVKQTAENYTAHQYPLRGAKPDTPDATAHDLSVS